MESIENIKSVYRRIEDEARCELNKVQQQIYRISTLRLLLFVAGIAGIIYFRTESWAVLTGIALVTLLPFILLIKYHNRLFHRKDYLEKEAEVNRQELAALDYDTSCFDGGEEFADPAHLYAYDLDVFGTHSPFQYINRTCTEPGRRLLADWLGQHLTKKEDILERQAAVRELAPELKFRQRFRILGLLHKGKAADETELKAWAALRPGLRPGLALGLLLHNLKFFIRQTCRLIEHCIRYCNLSNIMQQRTPVNQGYLPIRIGNRLQVLCDQRRILRHTLGMFLRIGILLIKHPADRCYRIYHQLLCIINRMLYFLLQLLLMFSLKNLVKLIEYVHHNGDQTKPPVKNRIIIQILSWIRIEQYPSYRCPEKKHNSQPKSDTRRYSKWHSKQHKCKNRNQHIPKQRKTVIGTACCNR